MEDEFKIISPAFKDGSEIPSPYTCKGQNINPPLNIITPPVEAKSFVVIMHDLDSVQPDFTHWLVWDIANPTETIAANSIPVGAIQGRNDAGTNQYFGPCPTAGTGSHRYIFDLYAIKQSLGLPSGSSRSELLAAMEGQIIAKTSLTGLFSAD